MKYAVAITAAAEADIKAGYQHLYDLSPPAADRWFRGLHRTIAALGNFAGYGPAREAATLGLPLRQRVYQSYRVVFLVDESQAIVTVHYVRHAARQAVGEGDDDDGGGDNAVV